MLRSLAGARSGFLSRRTASAAGVFVAVSSIALIGWRAPLSPRPLSWRKPAPSATVSEVALLLTFHQEGTRLLAHIDRHLFATDFAVRARAIPVDRAPASEPAASPCAWLASGALRLQPAGDSVVLLEYAGTADGRMRYRRRATMPVLRQGPSGVVVIDAAPLWGTLSSAQGNYGRAAGPTQRFGEDVEPASPFSAAFDVSPAMVVARSAGRDMASYQVDVVRLPRVPMRPRLYDPRVTYLNTAFGGGADSQGARYIYRWRLDRKDSASAVSDVVNPVIVRIDTSIAATWVPYVRRAVEVFNPVLESIGFRGALVVRTPADPLPPEEERGIKIRATEALSVSEIAGKKMGGMMASGGTAPTADPRTGEMLSAVIRFDNKIIGAYIRAYLALATVDTTLKPALTDWRRLPDSVVGRVIEIVITHEMAHALGLNHNFKANAGYPADSLRSASFLRRMGGPVAAIVGYSFFNFAAQPEDRVSPEDLVARLGPYDRWALNWGYRPIPAAVTPEAELPTLEQWRAAQDTIPYLAAPLGESDAYAQQYVLGDDLLTFVEGGIRNAGRVTAAVGPGAEPPYLLVASVGTAWWNLVNTVPKLLGGEVEEPPYPRDPDAVRTRPIAPAYQLRTMQFLLAHLFYGQDEMLRHFIVKPPTQQDPLFLFDSLAGFTAQQHRSLQTNQQKVLQALTDTAWLTRLVSAQPAARRDVCQALTKLGKDLTAAAGNLSAPTRQAQAATLQAIIAPTLDPGTGFCR